MKIRKKAQSSGVVATVEDVLTSTNALNALSAKQGKVLNDMISKRYLVTAYVSGTTGYNLYSDGYIEQWGETTNVNVSASQGTTVVVTLPHSMIDSNANVQSTMKNGGAYFSFIAYRAWQSSTTQISINMWNNNSANQATGISYAWKVVGYATV